MPIATPASTTARSTDVRPAAVVRITGRSAYTMRTRIAVCAPTPPMNGTGMRNPNIARLGIVWTMFASVIRGAPTLGRLDATMPSGTPIATATAVEATTSITCWPSSAATSAR